MSDENKQLLRGDRPWEGDKFRIQKAASSLAEPTGSANTPHGSAAKSKNTNLWRRYRITHVTVAWQERLPGKWKDFSKQITHEDLLNHYSEMPPNDEPGQV